VKFKAIAVSATAAALSLGLAGSAMAAPAGHTAKSAPQVTGSRLQSALLPASAFGSGYTVADRLNTGGKLWSTRVNVKLSSLSCANFETFNVVGGYGNTAGATEGINNPSPAIADYPSIFLAGDATVLQFKTASAATSFYNAEYSKYKSCSDFTEGDVAGNGSVELTNQLLVKTTIGKNAAFQLVQLASIASFSTFGFYENTAVVLSGTNVYTIDDLDGTNDQVTPSLLGSLISRVQALYKR